MTSDSFTVNVGVAVVFFALGWFACRHFFSKHPELLAARVDRKARLMDAPRSRSTRVRSAVRGFLGDRMGVTLLVFFVVIGVMGLQALAYQRQQNANQDRLNERDKDLAEVVLCFGDWGKKLVKTVRTRSSANVDVTRAQDRKDEALDKIIFSVAGLRAVPPEATIQDFSKGLASYLNAKAVLDQVKADNQATRQTNPYKKPRCELSTRAAVREEG